MQPGIKRGDVVLVRLDSVIGSEQAKTRPAVVIQHNALNLHSSTIIVVPLSSHIPSQNYPMHVPILFKGQKGVIKVEHIRSIDKKRIVKVLGKVSQDIMKRIGISLQHTTDFW